MYKWFQSRIVANCDIFIPNPWKLCLILTHALNGIGNSALQRLTRVIDTKPHCISFWKSLDQPWCNQLALSKVTFWYPPTVFLTAYLQSHCRAHQWSKCRIRSLSGGSVWTEGRSGCSRLSGRGGEPLGCGTEELSRGPRQCGLGWNKSPRGIIVPGQKGPSLRLLSMDHVHWCSRRGPERNDSFS